MNRRATTRRNFLKMSAALGAAPWIVPSSVFGAKAPSNRVNVAHLGMGGRANSLVGMFVRHDDVQILAICDCFAHRREEMRDKLNAKYGGDVVKAYADFREVLSRDDVDAVVIATPDHWHVPLAIAAARTGKDMYVEKPLGVCMSWAERLRSELQAAKRVFQYGTQQRSNTAFRTACELVRNGYIGEIQRVEAWCPDMSTQFDGFNVKPYGSTEPAELPEGFDYDMWLGPAPEKPYTVDRCTPLGAYHIYDYALGFIAGWGAHPLDIAQWGLGRDHTSPVYYTGTGKIPAGGLCDSIESWDVHCEYEDGLPIRFMGSRVAEPIVSTYRKWGDHGTTFFGSDGWVSVDRSGMITNPPALADVQLKADDLRLKVSEGQERDFIDCVKSREETISPIESAVRSDAISHLSDLAIRVDRPIRWDPRHERVVDDPGAAQRLHRPLRQPWNLDKPMVTDGWEG
ncbi:MAG TPA: Gfo/Idh/MocA family oxidoreductase [Candidatus Hydrogenedentes bacterium]|jgi:predicted dehydrogenase|nr:Gfo/Idh/MocA family oxidoreductase [Candidatus Hydrogenedentota bacterium]